MSGPAPARPYPGVVSFPRDLGAVALTGGRALFRVWAPNHDRIEVHLLSPEERVAVLEREDRGYHAAVLEDIAPGARYYFRLSDGTERPDPCSRLQADGVHGP